MKKFLSILVSLLLILGIATPVSAAQGEEDWPLMGGNKEGHYETYLTINPTNLQVSSFTIVNGSSIATVEVFIIDNGVETFNLTAPPNSTVSAPINNLKFHRLPLTDPDDPGSVRYPNGVYIGGRTN